MTWGSCRRSPRFWTRCVPTGSGCFFCHRRPQRDQLVQRYLRDRAVHSVDPSSSAVSAIEHHVFAVHGLDRYAVTTEIAARDGRVLLFLDTKHGVDQLTRHLRANGVAAAALHSGKSQPRRTRTLAQFKNGLRRDG